MTNVTFPVGHLAAEAATPASARRVLTAVFLSFASVGSELPRCASSESWVAGASKSLARRWVMLAAFLACRHLPEPEAERVKAAAHSFSESPEFSQAWEVICEIDEAARSAGLRGGSPRSPSMQPSAARTADSLAAASEAVCIASETLFRQGDQPVQFLRIAEAMVCAAGVGAIDAALSAMWSDVSDACSVSP